MRVEVCGSEICGGMAAPPSKSCAHRLLIAAFLSGEHTVVHNVARSDDMAATIGVLRALGGEMEVKPDTVECFGRRRVTGHVTADCRESGSTLRFLLPVACALGINATFTGSERLLARPIDGLVSALNAAGADIQGLSVRGRIAPGEYAIDGSVSSQYVSGLLFALSALGKGSTLRVTGKRVSSDYVALTVNALNAFGAGISESGGAYTLPGCALRSPGECVVEGDWSNAAFLLAAGAITGRATVTGLDMDSAQGDKAILNILRSFGAEVTVSGGEVTAAKKHALPFTVDIDGVPDLGQVAAALAAFANGSSVLKNVGRLQLKESDRVQAIISMLAAAGVSAERSGNDLVIFGGKVHPGAFDGGNDHRTVMASTVLALGADGRSSIAGAQAVNKSYPEFFTALRGPGGNIYVDI